MPTRPRTRQKHTWSLSPSCSIMSVKQLRMDTGPCSTGTSGHLQGTFETPGSLQVPLLMWHQVDCQTHKPTFFQSTRVATEPRTRVCVSIAERRDTGKGIVQSLRARSMKAAGNKTETSRTTALSPIRSALGSSRLLRLARPRLSTRTENPSTGVASASAGQRHTRHRPSKTSARPKVTRLDRRTLGISSKILRPGVPVLCPDHVVFDCWFVWCLVCSALRDLR